MSSTENIIKVKALFFFFFTLLVLGSSSYANRAYFLLCTWESYLAVIWVTGLEIQLEPLPYKASTYTTLQNILVILS